MIRQVRAELRRRSVPLPRVLPQRLQKNTVDISGKLLAQVAEGRLSRPADTFGSRLPGLRPMTPEYASPEQIRGANVTRVSDVYSLGVVLYELLTGHRPYRMKNRLFHEIVRVVCEEEPTLPSAAIKLPAEKPESGTTDGVRRIKTV